MKNQRVIYKQFKNKNLKTILIECLIIVHILQLPFFFSQPSLFEKILNMFTVTNYVSTQQLYICTAFTCSIPSQFFIEM